MKISTRNAYTVFRKSIMIYFISQRTYGDHQYEYDKKMDKIKINPFVSAHHGTHVDFNKRGIFSKSVLLYIENKNRWWLANSAEA